MDEAAGCRRGYAALCSAIGWVRASSDLTAHLPTGPEPRRAPAPSLFALSYVHAHRRRYNYIFSVALLSPLPLSGRTQALFTQSAETTFRLATGLLTTLKNGELEVTLDATNAGGTLKEGTVYGVKALEPSN